MQTKQVMVLSKLFQIIRKFHCLQKRAEHSEQLNIFQFSIIRYIAVNEMVSMQELAQEFGMRPSSMTENIDKLVEIGWITRTKDTEDKRKVILKLSNQAQENLNTLFRNEVKKHTWVLSRLNEKKIDSFLEILDIIEGTISSCNI